MNNKVSMSYKWDTASKDIAWHLMFAIILVFITLSTMSLCKIHLPLCCHVIINPPLTRSVSCQNSAMDSMHTGVLPSGQQCVAILYLALTNLPPACLPRGPLVTDFSFFNSPWSFQLGCSVPRGPSVWKAFPVYIHGSCWPTKWAQMPPPPQSSSKVSSRSECLILVFFHLEKVLLRVTLPPNLKCKSFKNQGSNQFYIPRASRGHAIGPHSQETWKPFTEWVIKYSHQTVRTERVR